MLLFVSPRPTQRLCSFGLLGQIRLSSSRRWQARQHKDQFTREAAVQGLKSRAAFKLLQVASSVFSVVITIADLYTGVD